MEVAEAVVMQARLAIVVLAGEAVVVSESSGGLGVAEGLGIPGPRCGAADGGGEEARGVQLIGVDIVDRSPREDRDGHVAQVDGLLTGDGFRCALPILRADPYGYYRHPHP